MDVGVGTGGNSRQGEGEVAGTGEGELEEVVGVGGGDGIGDVEGPLRTPRLRAPERVLSNRFLVETTTEGTATLFLLLIQKTA